MTRSSALLLFLNLCTCLLLVAGCGGVAPLASVRESRNLGVLAPFEGLYRRAGYAALESVRGVITDPAQRAQVGSEGWIPLALDTSRGAQRAAEKMLASSRTHAIVGPLHPVDAFAVLPILAEAQRSGEITWIVPFARVEAGFTPLDDPHWLSVLLRAAADGVATDAATRLESELESNPDFDPEFDRITIAGSDPFVTIIKDAIALAAFAMPVDIVERPEDIQSGALLMWLGNADDGVRFASAVRDRLPNAPVWFPQWAADAVMQEHAAALDDWRWEGLYWSAWIPASTSEPTLTVTVDASQAQTALLREGTLVALYDSTNDASRTEGWVLYTLPLSPWK